MNLTIKPLLKIKVAKDRKYCHKGITYLYDCPYLKHMSGMEYECDVFGFLDGMTPIRHKDCIKAEKNEKKNKKK